MKQLRREPITITDLFSGADVFLPFFGLYVLVTLAVGVVSAIFIVPVVVLAKLTTEVVFFAVLLALVPALVVYGLCYFAFPLIVDRNEGVFVALQQSVEMAKQNLVMFSVVPLVFMLMGVSGVLACCVGLLVTMPLLFTSTAVAYRDLFGLKHAGAPGMLSPAAPAYPPQAYNQQSWANQPPQGFGQPMPPQPQMPPRPLQPPQPPYSVVPPAPPQQPPPAQPFNPPPPQQPFTPPVPPQQPPLAPLAPTQVVTPPSAVPPAQQTCPHCQAVLQRAANFCNFCGKPLRQ